MYSKYQSYQSPSTMFRYWLCHSRPTNPLLRPTCTDFASVPMSTQFPIWPMGSPNNRSEGQGYLFLAPSPKITSHCFVLTRQTLLLWSWRFPCDSLLPGFEHCFVPLATGGNWEATILGT